MSTIFYAKLCSLLARRRSSQPVQRAYWPENVIDWLGKWRPICVMRYACGHKLQRFRLKISFCSHRYSVVLVAAGVNSCMHGCVKSEPLWKKLSCRKALSDDIRTQVVDKIIARGGDWVTGHIPVTYAQKLSRELKLSLNTVKNIWRRYCEEDQLSAKHASGFRWSKLEENDLQLIDVLKNEKPSITFAEIVRDCRELSKCQHALGIPMINNCFNNFVRDDSIKHNNKLLG